MSGYTYTVFAPPYGQSYDGLYVYGINSSDTVIGTFISATQDYGYIFQADGSFTTLEDPYAGSSSDLLYASAINDSGQVAGELYNGSSLAYNMFVYQNGTYTLLTDPSYGNDASPIAINDAGEIAGTYSGSTAILGFTYNSGNYTTLYGPDGAASGDDVTVQAMNASGEVVGYFKNGDSLLGGFVYNNGVYTELNGPDGNETNVNPIAINASGEVVGTFFSSSTGINGFTYQNGTYTVMYGPYGENSGDTVVNTGVNDFGVITGHFTETVNGNQETYGYVYDNGNYTVLQGPDGSTTDSPVEPVAVNNSGVVAGEYLAGSIGSDLGGFTAADSTPLCYLHGTRILTSTGAVLVEALRIGDAVVTRFGGIQRIKWLGRQSFAPQFIKNNPEKWPVCIKAGALEGGVPARDLFVSPGHSMLLGAAPAGDVLVLASCLVNGVTVVQARPEKDVHYVQIELEGHDCVVAEGAWAETFADAPGLRAQFHNAAEFYSLYPDEPPAEALALCAKRPERGALVAGALLPVVERAEEGLASGRLEGWVDTAGDWKIAGWARDVAHPDLPVRLEILVGEQVIGTVLACEFREDLSRAGKGRGRCAFRFTPPVRLGPAEVAALTIRRAADGAALPGTERFREASAA